jgi:hypothetical protein
MLKTEDKIAPTPINSPDTDVPRRYPLSPGDRAILVGSRALRFHGQPGLPIQTHLWLTNRVDPEQLRRGLRRLNVLYPMVTSRLVVEGDCAFWQTRPGAECVLHECSLESSDQAAVSRFAEQLIVQPQDLDRCDPISFHLLHLPDGRDVFVFQYEHTLMDATAAAPLIKEINRHAMAETEPDGPVPELTDEFNAYIRRFSWWQRFQAVWNVILEFIRRGKQPPITIGPYDRPIPAAPTLAVRVLSVEQCTSVAAWAERLVGVPSISMAVLSAAFRSIRALTTQEVKDDSVFSAHLGVRLRRVVSARNLLGNSVSLCMIRVPTAELVDHRRAFLAATKSLQDQLARRLDLGMAILSNRVSLNGKRGVRFARKKCLVIGPDSLRYGYFGSLASPGEKFLGVEIELAYKTALALPPWCLMLWVNQSGGKLVLSSVYHREHISDEVAQSFVDHVVADLTGEEKRVTIPTE